jgi:methionyl-tRNA formyltransferase
MASTIFMGFSITALSTLHQKMGVQAALFEDRPSNEEVMNFCRKNQIPFHVIQTHEDMVEYISTLPPITNCFVAAFGTILKDSFLSKIKNVINIHPADVRVCRGRHAFPQSIANGDSIMMATAHLIDSEKIDAGPIVALACLPFEYHESYSHNDRIMQTLFGNVISMCCDFWKLHGRFPASPWNLSQSHYFQRMELSLFTKIVNSGNLLETLAQSKKELK